MSVFWSIVFGVMLGKLLAEAFDPFPETTSWGWRLLFLPWRVFRRWRVRRVPCLYCGHRHGWDVCKSVIPSRFQNASDMTTTCNCVDGATREA